MWIAPKVNWKSTDYYNIEDWQRVRSNLEHIHSWIQSAGFCSKDLLATDAGQNYEALPYVYLVNNMESNLANLREAFGVDFTEDVAQKTWYERLSIMYSSNPTYKDWNRWETILKRIYESIQYIDNYVYTPVSGTCYSGADRVLLRFSRGR